MAFEREQFEWQKERAGGSGGGGGGGGGSSRSSSNPKPQIDEDKIDENKNNYNKNQYNEKASELDKAIAEGAPKDKIANAISVAERNGTITKPQANLLREQYTPRGIQY